MSDADDDLGTYVKPFKVVACLAVHGRLPLLEQTITRLYQKNGCYKVICSGDGMEERKLCESLGAVWVHARNKPLGNKWNQSFLKAKDFNPDAVLYVGSSDWVCNDWFNLIRPYVEKHHFAGIPGCSLVDLGETIRTIHWPGYKGYRKEREDETIGSGRMLSRRLLDAMGWLPFDSGIGNSLDRSMKDRAKELGFDDFMIHDDRFISLSLSTSGKHQWPIDQRNKHNFEQHWTGIIPSMPLDSEPFLSSYFPEVYNIFK